MTDQKPAFNRGSAPSEHTFACEMHHERSIGSFCTSSAEFYPWGGGLSNSRSVQSCGNIEIRFHQLRFLRRFFVFHIGSCGSHLRAATPNSTRLSPVKDMVYKQADQQEAQRAGGKPQVQARDLSLLDCGAAMLNFISADGKKPRTN